MAEIMIAVSGLVGTVLGALIGVYFQRQSDAQVSEFQSKSALDASVAQLLRLSIDFPFFENTEVCCEYPAQPVDLNERLRYESYCCFVFNTLYQAWKHFKTEEAVCDYIHVEEILHCHRSWWNYDRNNIAYGKEFRQFINGIFENMRMKGVVE